MLAGECTSGQELLVSVGGVPTQVRCFFDGVIGIDTQAVTSGLRTYRATDENSCPPGTQIWVPRTEPLLLAVIGHYGTNAYPLGVYGIANGCGGCTSYPMNSFSPQQASHWTSVGPFTGGPAEPWFLRSSAFGEPNGDYTAGCWLGGFRLNGETLSFNDQRCTYSFTSYVCSSNAWPPPPPPWPPLPPIASPLPSAPTGS